MRTESLLNVTAGYEQLSSQSVRQKQHLNKHQGEEKPKLMDAIFGETLRFVSSNKMEAERFRTCDAARHHGNCCPSFYTVSVLKPRAEQLWATEGGFFFFSGLEQNMLTGGSDPEWAPEPGVEQLRSAHL